jgi:Soluble lytic murein transglycosylase and related regulatory proteins (some contain LysM/invasin domains)
MAFAGYNAGRGRVAEWVAKHGDPRDPKVDAVDWIERIPFAETRNYVQRVMENLQVYCARFGASTATVEPNLHRARRSGRGPIRFWWRPFPSEVLAASLDRISLPRIFRKRWRYQ